MRTPERIITAYRLTILAALLFCFSGCDEDSETKKGCTDNEPVDIWVDPNCITNQGSLTYMAYPSLGTFEVKYTGMFYNICPDETVYTYIGIKMRDLPDTSYSVNAWFEWGQGESSSYTLGKTGAGANMISWFGWKDLDLKPAYGGAEGKFNLITRILFPYQGSDQASMQYYIDTIAPTLRFNMKYKPFK